MAASINDLYLKYTNAVGPALEEDRYFQYLFEIVQAGSNTIQQNNRILHKVVDEQWLTTIEESLDAINNIIEKPRRFVATDEEVVPVSLAKKITAESVRHLSMNTQFIASNEDGDIQPTRVLNVTTKETYDLYENRFIFHLIQRLITFIDKRTDVIFWSTGDEKCNTLKIESQIDDAYEQIEYKLELKVKNLTSFAENDSDNMQLFMRIDRVRRLVMSLRKSAFYGLMAGCAKVKSPIQRTNLIMKDRNYRTCYQLWHFLEGYNEVGYSIVTQDTALEFDEEYQIQLFTSLIANYTLFKSMMEPDKRKLEEVLARKRRTRKPKFVKQIKEEIVKDYDIPDVEVRKVIIEEVTQAQLDAEAQLEEEKKLRAAAEAARAELDGQLTDVYQQLGSLMQRLMDAEARADEQSQASAAAREMAEAAEAAQAAAEARAEEADEARRTAEEARDAAQAEKSEAERKQSEAESRAEHADAARVLAQTQCDKAQLARQEAESKLTAAEKARSKAEACAAEAQEKARTAEAAQAESLKQRDDANCRAEEAERACREATTRAAVSEKAREAAERRAGQAEKSAAQAENARLIAQEACTLAQHESESALLKCREAEAWAEQSDRLQREAEAKIAPAEQRAQAAELAASAAEAARAAAQAECAEAERRCAAAVAKAQEAEMRLTEARKAQAAAEKKAVEAEQARHIAEVEHAAAESVAVDAESRKAELEKRCHVAEAQLDNAAKICKRAEKRAAAAEEKRRKAEIMRDRAEKARVSAETQKASVKAALLTTERNLKKAVEDAEAEKRARLALQEKADANSHSSFAKTPKKTRR